MTEITPALGLSAYFLGRRISGQRRKPERVPVAYLYNGVRLPPAPSHDSAVLPYMMLAKDNYFGGGEGNYYLWLSSAPWVKGILGCTIEKPSSGFSYAKSTDSWEQAEKWVDGSPFFAPSNPIWANYDVLNSDGTLYLAASEAVPIYE